MFKIFKAMRSENRCFVGARDKASGEIEEREDWGELAIEETWKSKV